MGNMARNYTYGKKGRRFGSRLSKNVQDVRPHGSDRYRPPSKMGGGYLGGGRERSRFPSSWGPRGSLAPMGDGARGFLSDSSKYGGHWPTGAEHDWGSDPSNHIPGPYDALPADFGGAPGAPPGQFPPNPDWQLWLRFAWPPIDPHAEWGYQPQRRLTDDYPWDFGPEWTKTCDVVPPGLEVKRKMGFIPPLTITTTCNVSGVARANSPNGAAVPANATYAGMICSTLDWPNTNGRPYWTWTRPALGSNKPVPYKVGRVALPLNSPQDVRQMQPQPTGQARTMTSARYITPSMDITVPSDRPPWKDPGGGHVNMPPPKGTSEEKPYDNTGRSVKDVYGALTEMKDFADCASKNTTRKNRDGKTIHPCHGMPLAQKLKCLAENAVRGNLDVGGFLECVAQNELTDALIGKISRRTSRNFSRSPYNPRRTSPIGWGVGGFSSRMR